MDTLTKLAVEIAQDTNKRFGGQYEAADVELRASFSTTDPPIWFANIGRLGTQGATPDQAMSLLHWLVCTLGAIR